MRVETRREWKAGRAVRLYIQPQVKRRGKEGWAEGCSLPGCPRKVWLMSGSPVSLGKGPALVNPLCLVSGWEHPMGSVALTQTTNTAALGQLHPWSSRSVRFIFLNPTPPQRCQNDPSKMQSQGAIPQLKHHPWLPGVLRLNP